LQNRGLNLRKIASILKEVLKNISIEKSANQEAEKLGGGEESFKPLKIQWKTSEDYLFYTNPLGEKQERLKEVV
jgi:transcriptional regulator